MEQLNELLDTDPPTYEVVKAANPTLCPHEAPLVTLMAEKHSEVDMTDLVDYYDSEGLSPQVAPFVLTSSLDPESLEEIKRELTGQTIQVTVQKVAESTGEERKKWIEAARKEVNILTKELDRFRNGDFLTSAERLTLKDKAKKDSHHYTELPCRSVFRIKPTKYKAQLCGCGNFESDTYGDTATNGLDACLAPLCFVLGRWPT
eukprot:4769681-Amphidinium_carterae.1